MSDECLCVHALGRTLKGSARLRAFPSVTYAIAPPAMTASAHMQVSAPTSFCSATVALVASHAVAGEADTTRELSLILAAQAVLNVDVNAVTRKQNIAANIVFHDTFENKTAKTHALSITLKINSRVPTIAADVTRHIFKQLLITPTGNIIPSFQYAPKQAPHPPRTPRTHPVSFKHGAKSEIKMSAGPSGPLAYHHDIEAEIKAESTLILYPTSGSLRATVTWGPRVGESAPTESLRARPVMRVGLQPRRLFMRVDHAFKKCLCAKTTILPAMTSPEGALTRINKKEDLRVISVLHPDSKKPNPDGSYPPKKYIWRLTVTPPNNPPCACEFIHFGLYHFRNGKWGFNETRPVLLLVPDSDYTSGFVASCFDLKPPPIPRLYPQFNANGEYRVVMVTNLMYDIYPPATFVRTEYEGEEMNPVDREVILNEISHLVVVYEGCGGSFFMINAECD